MPDDFSPTIRDDYDRLAADYTTHVYDELRHKPFDREQLQCLAERLRGKGKVCDLGCGPGQVARFLRDHGADSFGLDLSPGMVREARRLNPDLEFREGNMLALPIKDASLAGIAAFYAIVNLPKEALPAVFREMARVLQPGGLLLLSFHAGAQNLSEVELWGHKISMRFRLLPPSEIRRELEAAGLVIEQALERDPYPEVEYQSRRCYILATKPESPDSSQTRA